MNHRHVSSRALAALAITGLFFACSSSESPLNPLGLLDAAVGADGSSAPDSAADMDAGAADAAAADSGVVLPPTVAAAVARLQAATTGRAARNCDCFHDGADYFDDRETCMAYYGADATDMACVGVPFSVAGRNAVADAAYANCLADVYDAFNSCFDTTASCGGAGGGCFTAALRANRTQCATDFNASSPDAAVLTAGLEAENLCRYGARQACPGEVSSALGVGVFTGSFAGKGDDFRTAGSCTDGYTDMAPVQTFTGADVAYLWKPPSDGTYVFDTRGSRSNVLLSVREGCSDTAPVVGCGLSGSRVTAPPNRYKRAQLKAVLRADTTYTVVVDTPGRSSFRAGNYAVSIYKADDVVQRTTNVVRTALNLDIAARSGVATIQVLVPTGGSDVLLEVGDLRIDSVSLGGVAATPSFLFDDMGRRQMQVSAPTGARTLVVNYHFASRASLEGINVERGWSYLWPNFCGNLFPCESDTADGSSFTMQVTGVPSGLKAIFPTDTLTDAPSYMAAVAVGNYTQLPLGTTNAGTKVSAWYLPGELANATTGTAHLRAAFDRAERTYGAYRFGNDVATVSVARGGGGMEHHPFWHIGQDSLADEKVNVHEAMHGWYGNGVRMACWEDFVLSEGTTEYLTWRTMEMEGVDISARLACDLKNACAYENAIAYPTGCNAIDINYSPLWSSVPYKKGAYFYRRVSDVIGLSTLDGLLRDFYLAHAGEAMHMQDMVEFLVSRSSATQGTDIRALAQTWLRDLACPAEVASLTCP